MTTKSKPVRRARLILEELESRALLTAMPVTGAAPTADVWGNSTLDGGGFPADAAATVGGLITTISGTGRGVGNVLVNINNGLVYSPLGPDATTGLGQMTIATGANSFGMIGAVATAGFNYQSGGSGGPVGNAGDGDLGDTAGAVSSGIFGSLGFGEDSTDFLSDLVLR